MRPRWLTSCFLLPNHASIRRTRSPILDTLEPNISSFLSLKSVRPMRSLLKTPQPGPARPRANKCIISELLASCQCRSSRLADDSCHLKASVALPTSPSLDSFGLGCLVPYKHKHCERAFHCNSSWPYASTGHGHEEFQKGWPPCLASFLGANPYIR